MDLGCTLGIETVRSVAFFAAVAVASVVAAALNMPDRAAAHLTWDMVEVRDREGLGSVAALAVVVVEALAALVGEQTALVEGSVPCRRDYSILQLP